MLIIACSFPTTQRLHSFKFYLVDKSHSQHSVAAVRCLGRHFLILYACTHEVSFPDKRPQSETRPVYRRNGQLPRRSFPPWRKFPLGVVACVTLLTALGKVYEHHVDKALPTCSYTKNSLFTALVNCKARMVTLNSSQYDSILCCSWSVVMITEL